MIIFGYTATSTGSFLTAGRTYCARIALLKEWWLFRSMQKELKSSKWYGSDFRTPSLTGLTFFFKDKWMVGYILFLVWSGLTLQ